MSQKNHAKKSEDVPNPGRRSFIGLGLKLGAGLVLVGSGVYGGIKYFEKSANDYLDAFPDSIPGAAKVEKYKTPDAAHCLVHIGQIHDDDFVSSERMQEMVGAQRDIYSILSYLISNHSLSEVYLEGAVEDMGLLSKRLKKPINVLGYRPDIFKDAGMQLSTEGKLYIKAAEDKVLHERAVSDRNKIVETYDRLFSEKGQEMLRLRDSGACTKEDIARMTKEIDALQNEFVRAKQNVYAPREDFLLRKIVENGDKFAVAVYGNFHDWTDNVAAWNNQYQDEKFSLIRVTPQSIMNA